MIVLPQQEIPRTAKTPVARWRPVLISAMALVLVAAASEYDASYDRLKTMPAKERDRLLESLRRFDLQLSHEQKSAVLDLDRRLAGLPPGERAHYLEVLRRYHTWLNSLPEPRQEELAARPPADRLALVRSLIRERPVPTGETPTNLQVIEPGEYNPFEVASAFKIWEALNEKERADVEKKNADRPRREYLFLLGARPRHGIPRETLPPDFDEDLWIGRLKDHWGTLKPLTILETPAKAKIEEAVKKRFDSLRPGLLRRQAINLYVSRARFRSVEPERLERFMAALPPWIPPTFDSLSPDEARRRMSFAYRLIFPDNAEIGATRKAAGAANRGRPASGPRTATPPKAKGKAAEHGESAAPF